jgi:hypothetical protein
MDAGLREHMVSADRIVHVHLIWRMVIYVVCDLRATENKRTCSRRLGIIFTAVAFMGNAIGLMCANNFICWLDRGQLCGNTQMQVRK